MKARKSRRNRYLLVNLNYNYILIIILVGVLSSNCTDSRNLSDESRLLNANRTPQGFIKLRFLSRPNTNVDIQQAYEYRETLDQDSVELWEYRGGIYYHPTDLCHRCQIFLAAFHQNKDEKILHRVERTVERLTKECLIDGEAAFTTCGFRYAVHADSSNTLEPPWLSGMSQGEFLMVLMRLYEFTDDERYLDFAHKIFKGFLRLKENHEKWVARIDTAGFYWIEEYPHDKNPGMTLNGFIAAIFGIYDYYLLTGSEDAKMIYELSLTTIKHYAPYFRNKGKSSYYCLGHRVAATEGYHLLHESMMRHLNRITGDPFFEAMADVFAADKMAAFPR